MPFYSGKDGELEIVTTTKDVNGNDVFTYTKVAKVRSWNYTTNLTTLETTTLGDTDRTTVAGVRNASGTCDLYYYTTNPNDPTKNSASVLLNKLIKASTNGQGAESESVDLKFIINDGTTTKKYIEGNCLFTSAAMSMAVGEVLSASISFEFVGSPRRMVL